jgi:hypothetical protein
MSKIASQDDIKHIEYLLEKGYARRLDPQRVRPAKLVCACSDGRAGIVEAIIAAHKKCVTGERTLHMYATEGGGLIYDLASTIPDADALSRIFISRMRFIITEKMPQISKIVLVHHWPCAMAIESGMSRNASIRSIMRARERVERELGIERLEYVVHIKVQVCHRDNNFELLSVYMDPVRFLEYLERDDSTGYSEHMAHRMLLDIKFPRKVST